MEGFAVKAKFVVSAVACAALATGVSGCGKADAPGSSGSPDKKAAEKKTFDGQSPDQIADKSVTATKKADSVRIRTEAAAEGRSATSDYVVDTKGNCAGTNTQQDAEAEMRRVDSVTYLKGNQQYWEALLKQQGAGAKGEKAASAFKDKWVKLPPADAKAAQAGCDKDAVIALFDRDKSERKGMTRAKDTQVDGKNSAVLQKRTAGGETITMYVAAEGEPYILKVEQKGGKAPITTTFSDYGKPVDAKAPPAGEVVDPQKQQKGGAAAS
ncbi:lipoprotein [Streptomyces finlayi]|uniref:Lipoprotein n=1 Tax=Streptomyces finlayi TaxID=67296 RepID=A0A918X1V1_9ACTN|nr:hypothetical protein [Streptomyces finlayi]GHD04483.1 lipoprotein [Streptomyces finlayi]